MMTAANYGFYIEPTPVPEWIRAERYDYCDNFFEEPKHIHFIRDFFRKLFHTSLI